MNEDGRLYLIPHTLRYPVLSFTLFEIPLDSLDFMFATSITDYGSNQTKKLLYFYGHGHDDIGSLCSHSVLPSFLVGIIISFF